MAYYKLSRALADLTKSLTRTQRLAAAAQQWTSVRTPRGVPKFSMDHKNIVTEFAFLRAFLAWEVFLEESFVLYLLGKKPPKGHPPRRHAVPRNRKVAKQLMGGDRDYADWTTPDVVIKRAGRFFEHGQPYSPVLRNQQSKLQDIKTIRNAVVHSSTHCREKFKSLARRELVTYPPSLTVGGFLAMTMPGSSPPRSFLELYLRNLLTVAELIVPN